MLDPVIVDANFAYVLAGCSMPVEMPAGFQCSGPFEYYHITHNYIYFPLEVEPRLISPSVQIFLWFVACHIIALIGMGTGWW